MSRSHQVSFPFTLSLDIGYIAKFGEKLLRVAVLALAAETNKSRQMVNKVDLNGKWERSMKLGPFNNIQLAFSGLERLEEGQKGIEKFFGGAGVVKNGASTLTSSKPTLSSASMDEGTMIGKRKDSIVGGAEMRVDKKARVDDKPNITLAPAVQKAYFQSESAPPIVSDDILSFPCDRCSKPITLPMTSLPANLNEMEDGDRQVALQLSLDREKVSHLDYHFARDLLDEQRRTDRNLKPSAPATSSRANSKVSVAKETGQSTLKGFFGKRGSR